MDCAEGASLAEEVIKKRSLDSDEEDVEEDNKLDEEDIEGQVYLSQVDSFSSLTYQSLANYSLHKT